MLISHNWMLLCYFQITRVASLITPLFHVKCAEYLRVILVDPIFSLKITHDRKWKGYKRKVTIGLLLMTEEKKVKRWEQKGSNWIVTQDRRKESEKVRKER